MIGDYKEVLWSNNESKWLSKYKKIEFVKNSRAATTLRLDFIQIKFKLYEKVIKF